MMAASHGYHAWDCYIVVIVGSEKKIWRNGHAELYEMGLRCWICVKMDAVPVKGGKPNCNLSLHEKGHY